MQKMWSFFILCFATLLFFLYKSNIITKALTKIYIAPEVITNPIKIPFPINQSPEPKTVDNTHNTTKKINLEKQKEKRSSKKTTTTIQNTHKNIARSFLKHSMQHNTQSKQLPIKNNDTINKDRYNAKLRSCLQNSFNINKNKLSFSMPIKVTIKIYLELFPNGFLHDARLIEPTGIPELDSFALLICTDARKSFPPIPKLFGNKNGKFIAFFTLYPETKQGYIDLQSM